MPQYVVRLVHTADQCPMSNSKTRARLVAGAPELPKLAQKLGIKFVAGPLALMTEHESLTVVEAEKIETIEEFIVQSGMIQWNTAKISPARPLADAMSHFDQSPPPLY